jgi:hypothetical protein
MLLDYWRHETAFRYPVAWQIKRSNMLELFLLLWIPGDVLRCLTIFSFSIILHEEPESRLGSVKVRMLLTKVRLKVQRAVV